MKGFWKRSLVIGLVSAVLVTGTMAMAGGIKERMLQRQPILLDLKDRGIIGETSAGYLGFVTAPSSGQEVVAAENQDRKTIYAQIAQQQNISAELVARRRGLVLIERTSPGHFYQDGSGRWVKK